MIEFNVFEALELFFLSYLKAIFILSNNFITIISDNCINYTK